MILNVIIHKKKTDRCAKNGKTNLKLARHIEKKRNDLYVECVSYREQEGTTKKEEVAHKKEFAKKRNFANFCNDIHSY